MPNRIYLGFSGIKKISFKILNFTLGANWSKFYFLGVFAFSVILSGCVTSEYNVATHSQDVFLFSTEREAAMGRNISRKINEKFKISNSPYDIERLNGITDKIVKVVDRKELNYYFYVIEEDGDGEDAVNAFSLPGGYAYIFKRLLDLLSDDEVAFVMAHEIGHIVSRHHIKRLQAAMGYNLLAIASVGANADSQFSSGLSFALAQVLMGYSREDELNADELAIKYCKDAGFEPKAGIEAQEKLYKENKKEIRTYSYFRTHPHTALRIKHIKKSLRIPINIDDYMNF